MRSLETLRKHLRNLLVSKEGTERSDQSLQHHEDGSSRLLDRLVFVLDALGLERRREKEVSLVVMMLEMERVERTMKSETA